MGRSKIQVDEELLLERRSQRYSIKEIAGEMGVSKITISRRIAELENQRGILTKYRELQHLQLTSLQFRVLSAITPEKIADAKVTELVSCFSILSKAEQKITGGRGVRIKGLVQYLVELEKKEVMQASE